MSKLVVDKVNVGWIDSFMDACAIAQINVSDTETKKSVYYIGIQNDDYVACYKSDKDLFDILIDDADGLSDRIAAMEDIPADHKHQIESMLSRIVHLYSVGSDDIHIYMKDWIGKCVDDIHL